MWKPFIVPQHGLLNSFNAADDDAEDEVELPAAHPLELTGTHCRAPELPEADLIVQVLIDNQCCKLTGTTASVA